MIAEKIIIGSREELAESEMNDDGNGNALAEARAVAESLKNPVPEYIILLIVLDSKKFSKEQDIMRSQKRDRNPV